MSGDDLVFREITSDHFTGGCFLYAGLPYTVKDCYFEDTVNDVLVLLSGCLYNRSEITESQDTEGYSPDPQFIAALFLTKGPAFVKDLNGHFAIFICRPSAKQAYLFRDHVGIQPLAYYLKDQNLYFSTDSNSLCRIFRDQDSIQCEYLTGYFRYIDYRTAPNKHVKKLLPGHYLNYSEKGVEVIRYWDPGKIRLDKRLSHQKMLDELKDLLSDAVRLRFDHRFTAGAHVTGGLDSGVVAALARTHFLHQDRFYGFSWSPVDHFPDNIRYDERDLVRSSCGMADIQPVFSTVDAAEYSRFVSGFYHTQGYFYENKTLEQAGELGVNLLFSGWGGDEFISMGDSGIDSDLLFHFKWRTFFQRNRITHLKGLIKTLLYFIIYPAFGLLDPKVARSFKEYTHYLNKPFKRSDRKALRDFYFYRSRRQQHLGLLHFYHLQSRTEAWAINGFRHGIEYRYPLLDKRIIEYILKIPSELLVKSGHYRPLVREISNGILPEEVRWHWEKVDPVQYAHEQDLIKTSAIAFMNEVELWRSNPDLSFINFDLLEKDIRWFKEHSEGDYRALFRTVVTIKGLHEFCHVYYK